MTDPVSGSAFPIVAPFGEDGGVVVVAKDQVYEGNVTFEGTGRIEGQVRGQVFSDGTLVLADDARVEGTIDVGALIAYGTVQGAVTAKRSVELRAPARIRGDLKTPALVVERGVLLDGRCEMTAESPAPPPLSDEDVPAPSPAEVEGS